MHDDALTIPPHGWHAAIVATLLFLIRNDEVLLIEKKRGFGAGKINGPGGKVEPGETLKEACLRETEEEIGLVAYDPLQRAELYFSFESDPSLFCAVFVSTHFVGNQRETEEARPFWCAIADIPYERMWEDDRHWLPHVLRGEQIKAWFHFDGDRMLDQRVVRFPSP